MFRLRHRNFDYMLYEVDNISNDLRNGKVWEPHLLQFMQHYIKKDDVCLDIGANFGYHTLEMSRLSRSVHAFEPQMENYILLQTNIKNNHLNNVVAHNNAVGNTNDVVEIPLFGVMNGNKGNINMGDISVNHHMGNFSKCSTVKIDDLALDRVDFVKIDVQGYEKFVLEGMSSTINKTKPLIVIEFEDHQLYKFGLNSFEILNLLKNLGYVVFLLDYDYPSDHVCVHSSRLEEFKQKMGQYIVKNDKPESFVCPSINHMIEFKIKVY